MIHGIGADLVDVGRVARLLERYGERFVNRVLSAEEIAEFRDSPNGARFLAKRFAAKEAFSKAVGSGLRAPVSMRNISIAGDDLGKPVFRFRSGLEDFLSARGIRGRHLSVSDEKQIVCAFVVLET